MSELDDILMGNDDVENSQEVVNGTSEAPEISKDVEKTTESEKTTEVNPTGNEDEPTVPVVENKVEEVDVKALQADLESERKKTKGLEAAQTAERRKRQKAEEDSKQKEDFWEDPEKKFTQFEEKMDSKIAQTTLNISERFARKQHSDFDEKMAVFKEMSEKDPSIISKILNDEDPAELAYSMANQNSKMAEFGDIKNFEEKIRAEEKVKFDSEVDKRVAEKLKKATDLPGSLANIRSTSDVNADSDNSLAGILGR